MKWSTSSQTYIQSGGGANDYWWACVLSVSDKQTLEQFGITVADIDNGWCGPIGNAMWNDNYTFEPIAIYSDLNGNSQIQTDMSAFSCGKGSAIESDSLVIRNTPAVPSYMTWKCRITKIS